MVVRGGVASSKMKTVALKQNSKCPRCGWEPPHRPQEEHTHSNTILLLYVCMCVCVCSVHSITLHLSSQILQRCSLNLDFSKTP